MKSILKQIDLYVLPIILVSIIVAMSAISDYFLNPGNLVSALTLAAPVGIIAIGMTFVILIGGIDLSVGSTFALSAVLVTITYKNTENPILAALTGLVVGLICGVINGILISKFGLPAIVATLATMAIYSGIAMGISVGRSNPMPESISNFFNGKILMVNAPLFIFLVVFIIAWVASRYTFFGDTVYSFGTNRLAAKFSGIHVINLETTIYALAGLLSATASLIFAATVASAKANFGFGYELTAITIVVVGGTSLLGGSGSMWGTILAVAVVAFLQNGLSLAFVSADGQSMYMGIMLIVTAIAYRWIPRFRSLRLKRSR